MSQPGKNYRWSIGTGACADVYKGKCIRAGIIDDTHVSHSHSSDASPYLSYAQTFVAVKLLRVAADESQAEMEARNRVSSIHVHVINNFRPWVM